MEWLVASETERRGRYRAPLGAVFGALCRTYRPRRVADGIFASPGLSFPACSTDLVLISATPPAYCRIGTCSPHSYYAVSSLDIENLIFVSPYEKGDELDPDMQELAMLVLSNSTLQGDRTRQTFLNVARSLYYVALCSPAAFQLHVDKVLFQDVLWHNIHRKDWQTSTKSMNTPLWIGVHHITKVVSFSIGPAFKLNLNNDAS